MENARYPHLRNWEKRCEIHSRLRALQQEMDAAQAGISDDLPEDEFDAAWDAVYEKYQPEIDHLRRLERSLELKETRNKWFCGIVAEKGVGTHRISERQADCFSRYFEEDEDSWRSHKVYCRAAGFMCALYDNGWHRELKIEAI